MLQMSHAKAEFKQRLKLPSMMKRKMQIINELMNRDLINLIDGWNK